MFFLHQVKSVQFPVLDGVPVSLSSISIILGGNLKKKMILNSFS
jgi:hypothetical protein